MLLKSPQRRKTSPPKKECSGYYSKVHLMVRLQSCNFEECRVPSISITPRSTRTWSSSLSGSCLWVKRFTILETLCANRTFTIRQEYLKLFNCVQTKWALAHLKKHITYKLFIHKSIHIYVCMCVCVCVCKQDLVVNNLQRLICHKTQPTGNKIIMF